MNLSLQKRAVLSLAIIALGYALLSLSIRFLSGGFQPFTQVYLRIGLGFVFALMMFGKDVKIAKIRKISKKDWLLMTLMGTLGYGLAIDFVTLGVIHTKLLNAAVLGSIVPLFVFLYSFIFLRHHVNKKLFIFVIISIYGAAVLSAKSYVPLPQNFSIGDIYMLLFAAGFACYSVARRFLSHTVSNKEITLIVMFIAFATSFVTALLMRETIDVQSFTKPLVLLGLILGIILNIASTQLENFAFQHIKPIIGSQILLLENFFALIFGYVIYHEYISLVEFIGAGIILSAVLSSNIFGEKEAV